MKLMIFIIVNLVALSSLGQQPIFTQSALNTIYDKAGLSEPAGKMVGRVPKNYEEIMTQGADAPIELIQNRHEQVKAYWQNPPASLSEVMRIFQLDTSSIKELNIRAVDIWEKLVRCNQNNPEAVRYAYYFSEKICTDPADSTQMSEELSELGRNYQQFLFSTPLLQVKKMSFFGINRSVLHAVHPLLVQIAIQQWAIFLNHGAEAKLPSSSVISQTIDQQDYNEQQMQFNFVRTNPDVQKQVIKPLNQSQELILKLTINNLVFLSLISGDGLEHPCHIYGLWPAMNRVILQKPMLWDGLNSKLGTELSAIDQNVTKFCGRQVKFLHSGEGTHGVYGQFGTTHILQLRRLYVRWVGVSWLPDGGASLGIKAQTQQSEQKVEHECDKKRGLAWLFCDRSGAK